MAMSKGGAYNPYGAAPSTPKKKKRRKSKPKYTVAPQTTIGSNKSYQAPYAKPVKSSPPSYTVAPQTTIGSNKSYQAPYAKPIKAKPEPEPISFEFKSHTPERSVENLAAILRGETLKKPEVDPSKATSSNEILREILAGNTLKNRKKVIADPSEAWDFFLKNRDKTTTESGIVPQGMLDERDKSLKMQELLKSVMDPEKAPDGFLPTPPKRYRNRFSFYGDGKKGVHWDQEFIDAELSQYAPGSFEAKLFLQDMLKHQTTDRQDWLYTRNMRKTQQIKDVLDKATQGIWDNNNPNILRDKLAEDPTFLDLPAYDSEIGLRADEVWSEWVQQRGKLSAEEAAEIQTYKIRPLHSHLVALEKSYRKSRQIARDAIKDYRKDYDKAIKAKGIEDAGPAIPDLSPPTGSAQQQIWDDAARAKDPRQAEDLGHLLVAPMESKKANRDLRRTINSGVNRVRNQVKRDLGIKRLPTTEEMLQIKAREGNLDPNDRDDVRRWIDRFENPNHTDTRAMYAAFAMQQNPASRTNDGISQEKLVEFVHKPLVEHLTAEQKRQERNAKFEDDAETLEHTGFFDTVQDAAEAFVEGPGAQFSRNMSAPFVGTKNLITGDDRSVGGITGHEHAYGEDSENNLGAVGWTFDKLMRLNYGMAGFYNGMYNLNEDPEQSWSESGWAGSLAAKALDPLSILTGASWIDSIDDVISDPSNTGKPFHEAYEQVFRGSGLPGVEDDIIPITFSTVIADQAIRDDNDDVYDHDWYQHMAGFALDAGTDPLNLAGVGVVNDVLKLPVGKTKDLAKRAVDGTGTYMNQLEFLDSFRRFGSSPIAEKAFRARNGIQRLGDNVLGENLDVAANTKYTRKVKKIQAEARGMDQSIQADRAAVKTRRQQFLNDLGVESLRESIAETHQAISEAVSWDLRLNRLAAQTSTPIGKSKPFFSKGDKNVALENPGGRLYDWVQKMQANASDVRISQGRFTGKTQFEKSVKGEDAARAADELVEWERIGSVPAGTRLDLENRIAAGSKLVPDMEAYIKAGMPGMPKTGWTPVTAFAKSMNISTEAFLRRFNEQDVYQSLVMGPRLLMESDPKMFKRFQKAQGRIQDSKRTIDRLVKQKANHNKIRAAYKSLQVGYRDSTEISLMGALHHLDNLQHSRNKAWMPSPDEAELSRLFFDIDDALRTGESLKVSRSGYGTEGWTGRSKIERDANFTRNVFDGVDFKGMTLDDILDVGREFFKDPAAQLMAARKELQTQMDEITGPVGNKPGLSATTAYKVEQMLPETSGFRKTDGSLDLPKIERAFDFEPSPKSGEAFKITYKIEGKDPGEHEFFGALKGALEWETRHNFQEIKTEILAKKKPAEAVEETAKAPTGVEKLGARPTFESLREQFPGIYARTHGEGKGRNKAYKSQGPVEGHTFEIDRGLTGDKRDPTVHEVSSTAKDLHLEFKGDDAVIMDRRSKYIGKKSKGQDAWQTFVKKKQRQYDKAVKLAKEGDAAKVADELSLKQKLEGASKDFKLTKDEMILAQNKSYKQAVDETTESLTKGEIPQVPTNMRLTIRESYADAQRKIKLEHQYEIQTNRLKQLESQSKPELDALKAEERALDKEYADLVKSTRAAYDEAIKTRDVMSGRLREEDILQMVAMPDRIDGRVLQLRFAGAQKNLQFTNSMFRGVEQMSHIIPSKVRESFANNFVRPSKNLKTDEAIHWRAIHESQTPAIIKAVLSRLSNAMRDISKVERNNMFKHYLDGTDYRGTNAGKAADVKNELDDIEDILNGRHEFFHFKDPSKDKGYDPLHPHEILRYTAEGYGFKLDDLYKARYARLKETVGPADDALSQQTTAKTPFGKQIPVPSKHDVKIVDVIEAIKMNKAHSTPKDLYDPFRFAWVMQLAATQARQARSIHHSIKDTFGVKIPDVSKDANQMAKRKVTLKLKDEHGWQKVKDLQGHLFPPEAVQEINKLLEIMKPGKAQMEVTQLFDKAIGYWKQGMTIYNPGYYTRNGIGEIMSSWLDGVNHPKYYNRARRVGRFAKKEDHNLAEMMKRWSVLEDKVPVGAVYGNERLFSLKGGQNVTIEDAYRLYTKYGLKSTFANTDLDRGVRALAGSSLSSNSATKALRKTNEKVHDVGEGFEDYLRMAHFLHAMEHSGRGSLDAAAEYAAKRVTKYHFDYTDFSKFEKAVMLRAFPFYKWTRRGAPLMLAHLFLTPGKMAALPKAMDAASGLGIDPMGLFTDDPVMSTSDVHDDMNGNLPDYNHIAPAWARDLFAYQMQPAEDDEYANYFRIQTPQIDGLQGALKFSGMSFGDSAAYPLLNPAIKAPIELLNNKGMDPDFPYPIAGGEFNENMGISDGEGRAAYLARNLNPWTGFLAKLSKNGQLGPLNISDQSSNRDVERDVASQLTGLGFYQSFNKGTENEVSPVESGSSSAVGPYNIGELPMFSGAPAASGTSNPSGDQMPEGAIEEIIASMVQGNATSKGKKGKGWIDYPKGRGWIDYPKGQGWRNFGSGGYGGGGYSSGGGSVGSSGGGTEFWALLQQLKAMIDQGDVI